jgi:membrane fusion protein (multidrug efflux system)
VQVLEVTATNVPHTSEIIGQLDSPQNVEVRARVEAFVEKVLFVEGSEVSEGEPLFALDKKPFLEQLAAAQGALAEAKASLNKYEKDVARLQPLAEKRAIPQQDLDNAMASVDVGRANVLSALAGAESAKLDLSYCDVRAPASGRIGAKEVSIGDLVGKGEPTLLAVISTLDPIWFYCSISEVAYLRASQRVRKTGRSVGDVPVTLILADGSEFPEQGKWVFIDRAVDPTTGTLRMRAEFANTDKVLRPGMFARARIRVDTEEDSILIPQRAVQELQGTDFVWVIGSDNRASQRPVTAGAMIGGDQVIEEGLKPGERIVVEGVHKAREGEAVQPVTAAEAAQGAATKPAAVQPQPPAREE